MDPGGIGALIGISIMVVIGIGFCIHDKCPRKPNDQAVIITNPLLKKHRSFKVKNLFNHVEI